MNTNKSKSNELLSAMWGIKNKAQLELLWENRGTFKDTQVAFVRDLRIRFGNDDVQLNVSEFKRILELTKQIPNPQPSLFVLFAEFTRKIDCHEELAELLKRVPSYWYIEDKEKNLISSLELIRSDEYGIVLGVKQICSTNEKNAQSQFIVDFGAAKGAKFITRENGVFQAKFIGGGAIDDVIDNLSPKGNEDCSEELMSHLVHR